MNISAGPIRREGRIRSGASYSARSRGTQAGFSLIEVLVVTFMLGVVALSLVGVFAYGFQLLSKTKEVTMATQVAQILAERARNTDYDLIPVATGTPVELNATDYPFLFTDEGVCHLTDGQVTVGVTQGLDENLKRLEVTVIWDFRGRPMRKDVITYIAKDGINRR